jgi:hypothetical protein
MNRRYTSSPPWRLHGVGDSFTLHTGKEILHCTVCGMSRSSSVSIVSDYGLDDRAIGVRSPVGAKDFSSNLCVQTGSGANPSSCTMGTGVLSPGQSEAGA